jgi:hypothetical protein
MSVGDEQRRQISVLSEKYEEFERMGGGRR